MAAGLCFFAGAAALELALSASGRRNLLRFKTANYARSFTYGMFFACTWFAATHSPGSTAAKLACPLSLYVLAALVAAVNLWETGRHAVRLIRR
ncbi:MAG: hypothetical protein PHF00_08500 [Elusimicrobia bacterium]|nr:hypothetical protein [Elusimicrobiota bacterium]